jgi:hypothetical protein
MSATPAQGLRACVQGIGLLGPGLPDWPTGAALLRGETAYQAARTEFPPALGLPAAERRRATAAVKLALATGGEALAMAGRGAADLRTVFAASSGDGPNCHALCEALASQDRLISPTRFHNSVHNAASGYWGIATGSMAASAVLCAPHDGSFAAGLLEALVQLRTSGEDVLLLAYDTEYPEPLRSARPIADGFAVALLLSPRGTAGALASIAVDPAAAFTDAPAHTLEHAGLEALRRSIPTARSLSLLQRLARAQAGRLVLEQQPGRHLAIELEPC